VSGTLALRVRKLAYSVSHRCCWNALRFGVAPSIEHRATLGALDCDLILDVGGNRGQFTLISRIAKPGVPIVAFEPIPTEAEVFLRATSRLKEIQLHQVALGEDSGEADIHLSRSADSSSLLPIGEMQTTLYPATDEVGTLKVPVKRLDEFKSEWSNYSRILLKIDVQGFELSVLKGASEALERCAFVYVECSETELYVGQPLYRDVAALLNQQGFSLQRRCNESMSQGNVIQADYLFSRV
jgi:FkbM family methyltransferase